MKKVIAWLLVLALTATISIGATLAYLTDTEEDVNVMTLGKVKIEQLEYERVDEETQDKDAIVQEFHDNKPLYPAVTDKDFGYETGNSYVDWDQIGKADYTSKIWDPEKINNEIDKMVFVKNKGDYDAFVRSVFAFETVPGWTFDQFHEKIHLNLNTDENVISWEWIKTPVEIGEGAYFVAVATYKEALKPGAFTEISLSQIALDSSATNEDVEALGDTYHVLVKSQAIQADGFISAEDALNEGFGKITADENIPFDTDQPVKGIDVRSALRFYQGNAEQPIHTKVTNVVFGLNKDHANIVNNYEGTLVTEEQDVDVYSYYVEEDGKYTVYFLANGNVNLPRDSSGLFQDMMVLNTVDTGNLNTGNTQLMNSMFLNCYKLTDIIGSENWDTGNVTNMEMTFAFCKVMMELNVSGWNVSAVKSMTGTFGQCFALEKVDTTGWNPVNVTTTRNMFYNCYALKSVIGSGDWVLPSVKNMNSMFQSCSALEYIDVTDWDLSSAEKMASTFWKCTSLKEIDGTRYWNTSNVTTLQATFEHCTALETLDVSTWDTRNVTSLHSTFYNCYSLPGVDVSNWDTGNVTTMQGTFSGNGQNTGEMIFTELPVENWDVSKVTTMNSMFYGCGQLTELDLSKWDTRSVTNFRHVFADCFKLEKLDFTGWNTESATNFDGMFNDCTALKELDVSDFDTGKVTTFHQFFEGCASLTTVIGMDNWDTSSLIDMSEMFYNNGKDMHLEYIDLSAFNTSNVTTTYSMFGGCTRLATVYVGDGWDMSLVTNSGSMFAGCGSLTGANGTTTAGNPTDVTYARVDTPAAVDEEGNVITDAVPGYLTYKTITKN